MLGIFWLSSSGCSLIEDSSSGCYSRCQSGRRVAFDTYRTNGYNSSENAELCSGSTGDFGSSSPGSNPGSAATLEAFRTLLSEEVAYPALFFWQ